MKKPISPSANKSIGKRISSFFSKLTPKMEVAGLWIGEGSISFYNVGGGKKSEQISLRLPPGVVSGGAVQNQEALTKVLLELHKRTVTKAKKTQGVILTIPIANVYIQPFALPAIVSENISESVKLNMGMMSPIEIDKAYYDWQKMGEEKSDQIEIVGAFAPRDIIEGFITSVQDAGYSVAAVEFNTLSLSRAALNTGIIDGKSPIIFLEIAPEGINFSINHLGNLFFHHFVSWKLFEDGGKSIQIEKFKDSLADETRRIINFYSTNQKGQEVKKMVLVASNYVDEVKQIISERFPGIEVEVADPKQVNPVVGAALRGTLSRSDDFDISLTSLSAKEVFNKYQLANFIVVWRDILAVVFGFILLFFLSSALLLQNTSIRAVTSDSLQESASMTAELSGFKPKVQEFNTMVSMVGDLLSERKEINKVINKLREITDASIILMRINVQADSSLVWIECTARDRDTITRFKNTLEEQSQFEEIDLSLANIKTQPNGTETFSLSFKFKSADF